jgi:hypothetical protein
MTREDLLVLGATPGVTVVQKFGGNPAVSTTEEDIWAAGGKETLLTTGTTLYASCEDNVNGVGQIIRVEGLDENWAPYTADVVLTGYTQAQIGNANGWTRAFRAYQVSAEPDPVGDVWVAELDTLTTGTPDTATKVHAYIDYTDAAQITEKAMYTVPAGHVAFVARFHAEMGAITSGAARSSEVFIEQQTLAHGATAASPSWTPWRRIVGHNISNTANSDTTVFIYPMMFPELTNVHVRATATATSVIDAEFTLVIYPAPDGIPQDW